MEPSRPSTPSWPQGPPADGSPPGAAGGAFPEPWAAPLPPDPTAAAPRESPGKWDADQTPGLSSLSPPPAFAPAPQSLNALVHPPGSLSSPTVQENKVDQSKAKKQKTRTTFTEEQLNLLRRDFAVSKYITPQRGRYLAQLLGLSYKQVKTWFQNQRLKTKRPQMVLVSSPHDPRLPQLGPAIRPQGFRLSSSFHTDPGNNHPGNYSGWSDRGPEGCLPNYGEASSPYPDGPPTPLHYPPGAPMGHAGWCCPTGPQSSAAGTPMGHAGWSCPTGPQSSAAGAPMGHAGWSCPTGPQSSAAGPPMGHAGWSCPTGPQSSAAACGPLGMQRQLAPLPGASEAGSAYRPAPGGSGAILPGGQK